LSNKPDISFFHTSFKNSQFLLISYLKQPNGNPATYIEKQNSMTARNYFMRSLSTSSNPLYFLTVHLFCNFTKQLSQRYVDRVLPKLGNLNCIFANLKDVGACLVGMGANTRICRAFKDTNRYSIFVKTQSIRLFGLINNQ